MAGAPGFEPGIAGPKPAALPLGYAPPHPSIGTPLTVPGGIESDAAALGYARPSGVLLRLARVVAFALGEEIDERDGRNDDDSRDRRPLGDEPDDRDQHGRRL